MTDTLEESVRKRLALRDRVSKVIKVQRSIRRFIARKQACREMRAIHVIYELVRKFVKRWKVRRKIESAKIVVTFLRGTRGQSQALLAVKKFLNRVVQIQRVWRRFRSEYHAQFMLLSLQWDKIEEIIMGFLQENQGLAYLRTPKNKIKMKSLIEKTVSSKGNTSSSRSIPSQSLLPIHRFVVNKQEYLAKHAALTKQPKVSTQKSSPLYNPNTAFPRYGKEEYISPIPRHIKEMMLRPYIFAKRREYRLCLQEWKKEVNFISETREHFQKMIRRSSHSTMGFLAERYRMSADIKFGKPILKLLMAPEDMQHMIEQGFLTLEQENYIDHILFGR